MVLVNSPSAVDPLFAQFFAPTELFYWYMPLHPYRLFTGPKVTTREFYVAIFLYYFVLLSLFTQLILYGLILIESTAEDGEFLDGAESVVWFILVINAIQATYFSWTRAEQLKELIHLLHEIFPRSEQERQQVGAYQWAQEWTTKMKWLTIVFVSTILGMLLTPVFDSVVGYLSNGIWVNYLPLNLWFPFDPLRMPVYPLVYAMEVWFFLVNVVILMAAQSLMGAVTMLVCLQFKCAAHRIRSVHFGDYQRDKQRMMAAIHYHNSVLDISLKARELFSVSFFFNFVLSSMVVCVFMFLMINVGDGTTRGKYAGDLFCFWLYCCFYGYYGDEMIEHSSAVADAAYESNWLDADVRIQKMIVLVIQRAHSLQILTGLDFFVSSFPTLTKILTTSYSYLTVLRTTYTNDN